MKTIYTFCGRDKWILYIKGYIEDFLYEFGKSKSLINSLHEERALLHEERTAVYKSVRGICDQVSHSNVVYYVENFTRGEY